MSGGAVLEDKTLDVHRSTMVDSGGGHLVYRPCSRWLIAKEDKLNCLLRPLAKRAPMERFVLP